MHHEIELAPLLGDALEHRLHVARCIYVERHNDRSFQLTGEWLNIFLRLLVEICHCELSAKCPKSLGTAPSDRLVIGNANNETSFAFEEFSLHGRNHGRGPLVCGYVSVPV